MWLEPVFAEAHANATSEEQIVEAIACKNKGENRRLEVQTKDAGCILRYFKYNQTQEIAKARRGVELCKENLRKVRVTLERGGYSCE